MFKYLHQIWQSSTLRRRILFTLFVLAIFRLAGHIGLPGVNVTVLNRLFDQNSMLGVFSALTGGSMERFSIVLMGLAPYINASIIIQLMTVVIPKLEAFSKEGMEGRRKLNLYTRLLTVPLAFLQSYGMIVLLNRSAGNQLVPGVSNPGFLLFLMLVVTAGTLFLMWLGELISEFGIGNGISMIIFTGIVADIPTQLGRMMGTFEAGDTTKFYHFLLFLAATILMLIFVVLVTEGQRNIPITYATRSTGGKGQKSSLPIRVNQAGMIPIIFAVSMVTFPSVLAQFFASSSSEILKSAAEIINAYLNSGNPGYVYLILYFLLIVLFSFFYVGVTFNPDHVADSIQKRGGFIPGIRPGRQTAEFLGKTSAHLTLFGGLFIALVAVVPILFTKFTSLSSGDLMVSGSGMIIMVGVVLELMRQINSQMMMHDYDKLY